MRRIRVWTPMGSYTTKPEAERVRRMDCNWKADVGEFPKYRIRKVRVRWGSRTGPKVVPPMYAWLLEKEY